MLTRITRLTRLVAAVALPALIAGTLSAGAARAASTPSPVPKLDWTACAAGFECARARVPLDYAHPHGRTISLALTRLPATDPAHRIGSLFVNPGGPGGSGVEFVQAAAQFVYSPAVRARFDIVGFDPRFIGSSTPLATCASDDEFVAIFDGVAAVPLGSAQEHQTHRAYATYSDLCARRSAFLAHASTADVARDLDRLRQAVGDRNLSYVGYSYGSILGQTYAALFPGRIRSLTIDGVLDAKLWSTGRPGQAHRVPFTSRMNSADGAYDTFQQFTALCDKAGTDGCAFAAGGDSRAKYDRLARHLQSEPYVLPDGTVVTYSVLIGATLNVLYQPTFWAEAAQQLQDVYAAVFPAASAAAASAAARSRAAGAAGRALVAAATAPRWTPGIAGTAAAPPIDSGQAAFEAVTCTDTVNPRSEHAWAAAGRRLDHTTAPYFGRAWTWVGEGCASWRLPSPGRYLGPYDRPTSAPVLVIGNIYDPATPYSGARTVARTIPGAALLTVDGYGHTTLAAPSACAQAVFDAYLIAGRTPARGTVCHQDVAPFTG
jgi:pimeloyl-ACP methyl ester carboxylesterase